MSGSKILELVIRITPMISRGPNSPPANKANENEPVTASVISSNPSIPGLRKLGPQIQEQVPGRINKTIKIRSNGIAGNVCLKEGILDGAKASDTIAEKNNGQKQKPRIKSIAELFLYKFI